MIITNHRLLVEFRSAGRCGWCGRDCQRREPHHLWAKGMGGGFRLDVPCNLIALGSSLAFECQCHRDIHDGHVTRDDLLCVVAARENVMQDDIRDVVYLLRRLDRTAPPWLIVKAMEGLNSRAWDLAWRTLREAGVEIEDAA